MKFKRFAQSNKVFVATEGTYDDYHIIGVFSTRELAQQFGDVEEYTIDSESGKSRRTVFFATFKVKPSTKELVFSHAGQHNYELVRDDYRKFDMIKNDAGQPTIVHGLSAISKEDAHDLAINGYEKYLRQFSINRV